MQEKKSKTFFKKYGILMLSGLFILSIILTACLVSSKKTSTPTLEVSNQQTVVETSTQSESFTLPLSNCQIAKDYNGTSLSYNATLKEWSAHKWIDLTSSSSGDALAVLSGEVLSVGYSYAKGNYVVLSHDNGYKSVYASLDDVAVKQGDKITRGDFLGKVSSSAKNELDLGNHLHFELLKDDKLVDPNLYLDLSQK